MYVCMYILYVCVDMESVPDAGAQAQCPPPGFMACSISLALLAVMYCRADAGITRRPVSL